jgi:hypothetical protein
LITPVKLGFCIDLFFGESLRSTGGGGKLSLTVAVNGVKMIIIGEIQDGLHKKLWFSSASATNNWSTQLRGQASNLETNG